MKVGRRSLSRKKPQQPQHKDLMTALDEIESREKARLRVPITSEAVARLDQFLKEKGLPRRQSIPMIIQYGLSDESEEELKELKLEKDLHMGHLWGAYCQMKFRSYEYFIDNKVLTMRLQLSLPENRSLKMRLKKEGLQSCISTDEWDNWDRAVVDDYFQKYIFVSRL
jgi:hypothetical protein